MSDNDMAHTGGRGPQQAILAKWITKPLKVLVKPTGAIHGHEIECELEPGDNASRPYVTKDTIRLTKDEGPFRVQFLLDDLEWDEDNPFNTTRAAGCPPAGAKTNDDEQIFLQPANGKSLTVLNLNDGDACKIRFRMNFADGTYCDPIMDNGGRS
jgi:hypothetical protein